LSRRIVSQRRRELGGDGHGLSAVRVAIGHCRLALDDQAIAQVQTLKRRLGAATRRPALKGRESESFRTRRHAPSDGLSRRTIGEGGAQLSGSRHG
jgi:hypothetical protein